MVAGDRISLAARTLLEAAPRARVILFGSHARGDAGPESDLDFLVIEPDVKGRHEEMVRLSDVLRPHRIYADILVISERDFEEWAKEPGTVFYEAARTGRIFDASL